MNFRSYSDLVTTVATWQERLPRDFTLVCGVPRSGLLVASLLALQWNLPMTDVANLVSGRLLGGGRRLGMGDESLGGFLETPQRILVVEDSVVGGAGIREARLQLANLAARHEIKFAAVYATPEGRSAVDFAAEVILMPRVFEWNLFHHPILNNSCLDIDGVLCRDPSDDENDDGPRYREFLQNVSPRFLPSEKVGWLVTSRLEKYRAETAAWLQRHGVRYGELLMLDLPDQKTRMNTKAAAPFKTRQYLNTGARLFIESDGSQAEFIARHSGKYVICTNTMHSFGPGLVARRVLQAQHMVADRFPAYLNMWRNRFLRVTRRFQSHLYNGNRCE